MARIETYVEDNQVTLNDIVIGSDGDNTNQTKNFRVSALTQFVENATQNAVANITTTAVGVSETIESKLSSINLTVSAGDSPVLLIFLKDEIDQATSEIIVRKYVYLFPLGNGTYEPLSDTIGINDLVLIEVTNPTSADVDNLDNTQIIDLGDVTGTGFLADINASVPSYALTDSNITYFFSYEDSGSLFLQKFIGTNGSYGLNDSTAVAGDFISFSDTSFDDDNVKAKYVEITMSAASFASEALEVDDVARAVNLLDPNVTIADNELFVVYSDTLENDAGTNYRSVYIINTGKGTYGNGATQITSANVLKIRGEQINENLSSYTNDGGLATESYVDTADDLKVDKAGDTMTGALAMGANKVTSSATPTDDEDYTNKVYVDSLNRFRGEYSDSSTIEALTDNQDGDYATMSSLAVQQLWVYQGSDWRLLSAVPFVSDISAGFSINNNFHKATLNIIAGGNFTLTFPDGLINGLELNVRNFSGGTLTFASSGSATVSQTSLPTGSLATIINDGDDYIIDVTSEDDYDKLRLGIYDYDDSQTAITLTANTFSELSNNGAGTNTFKDTIAGVTDVYNVATDRFDFTDLNIGDTVSVRVDLDITTVSAGEVIDCEIVLGEGQAGEYSLPLFSSKYYKDADTYRIVEVLEIYIGNALTRDNPAYIQIKSSGNDDVNVNGFYCKVLAKVQ